MAFLQWIYHFTKRKAMMKRFIFTVLMIGIILNAIAQQDSQYTQYVFNTIHLNPAYAGYKQDIYVQSFFRSQWVGVKGAPVSFSIAADGAVNDGNVGLGLIVSNDKIGAQTNLSGYANYAYKIQMGDDDKSNLSFGIAAGIMQLGLDGTRLGGIDPNDEIIPVNNETRTFPDARFGLFYSNRKFFLGLSATNMIAAWASRKGNNNNLLVPVPQPHIYLNAGMLIPLGYGLDLKPVILLKDDTKGPTTLDVNAFFLLNEKVWIGGFYRTSIPIYDKKALQSHLTKKNALGMMFELFVSNSFKVGYSYDYSLNKLRDYNFGSHEISAGFYINRKMSKRDRELRCYDF